MSIVFQIATVTLSWFGYLGDFSDFSGSLKFLCDLEMVCAIEIFAP